MLEENIIWEKAATVRFRRVLDEAVLINQESAEALVLNDTAVSFIECCDGQRTVGEIIADMVQQFDVTAGELAADLEPFIAQLAAEGIIRPV